MKFSGRVGAVAIRITVWIHGLFSGFVTIGRYGKWLTDINLLLTLIRQMAARVRRALAEVCTVPMLLVNSASHDIDILQLTQRLN